MRTLILIAITLISSISFSQTNGFRFKITGNGYSDETIIRLHNNATDQFDGSYDAWKLFSPNPNVPSLYTKIAAGQELSINSLPEYNTDESTTLFSNLPINGNYTLTIEQIFPSTSNYKFSLTNLLSNTHYLITSDTSLVFSANAQLDLPIFSFNVGTPFNSDIKNETCVGMDNGKLIIDNKGNTDWDVSIYNGTNIILNKNVTSNIDSFINLSPGSYSAYISSKGIVDSIDFSINSGLSLIANFIQSDDTVYLDEGAEVNFNNLSQNAQTYLWDFDDGNTSANIDPLHYFSNIGDYEVSLSSFNSECVMEYTQNVNVQQTRSLSTNINSLDKSLINLYATSHGIYQISSIAEGNKKLLVYSTNGSLILSKEFSETEYSFSLTNISSGIYLINIINDNNILLQKKVLY